MSNEKNKIEIELDQDKEICIICNKPKDSNKETYYCGRDSKKLHYYHAMCLEKLKLLLEIRKSNALNSVDFKSLEIIFGILIDDIPNEIVSSLNQCRTEKQPKFEITLDLNKKIQIDIISKAFNMTPGDFIDYVITKEIDYVKFLLGLSNPKSELESYYEFEIDIDELKKLILVEAI